MEKYLTLSRGEAQFSDYLTGRFSDDFVAVPVQSLEVTTDREKITFHVKPRAQVSGLGWVKVLSRLFRWELLPMTFSPFVVVGFWAQMWGLAELNLSWAMAALSLLFLHGGVFAVNDVVDHMKGSDRIDERLGSRVIQMGHLPAYRVLQVGLAFLAASLLFAIPLVVERQELLFYGALALGFGVFGYSLARKGWWRFLMGGFSIFLVFGPLIVFGSATLFGLGSGMWVNQNLWMLAIVFGWSAAIYSRTRQLGTMMVDHIVGIRTLATRLGFDRAKALLTVELILFQAFVVLFWFQLGLQDQAWVLPGLLMLSGLRLIYYLVQIQSPVGSKTQALPGQVLYFQFLMGIVFCLEFLWLGS